MQGRTRTRGSSSLKPRWQEVHSIEDVRDFFSAPSRSASAVGSGRLVPEELDAEAAAAAGTDITTILIVCRRVVARSPAASSQSVCSSSSLVVPSGLDWSLELRTEDQLALKRPLCRPRRQSSEPARQREREKEKDGQQTWKAQRWSYCTMISSCSFSPHSLLPPCHAFCFCLVGRFPLSFSESLASHGARSADRRQPQLNATRPASTATQERRHHDARTLDQRRCGSRGTADSSSGVPGRESCATDAPAR